MAKAKILIVEDELIVAKDIQNMLHRLSYDARDICISGEDALKLIKTEPPDLVLMDIILKGRMNGIQAAREIRRKYDLPIIFLSAYANINYINRAKAAEPYGYILKPIDEKSLRIPIELALAKHAHYKQQELEADEALRESEDRHRVIVENISEGIFMQDKTGNITYVNERLLKMLDCDEEQVLGNSIHGCLGDRMIVDNHHPDISNNGWNPYELTWKRKDGSFVYMMFSPKPIYDEKRRLKGSVTVATDITERRKMELELKRSEEELRRLSQYIQSVRERESQRIAREIHDELGQKLTALKMDLSWLSQRIVLSDVGQIRYSRKVEAMSNLIDKTIQTVQKICSELRPGLLDDLGLIPAIEWLAQDFQKRTGIICRTRFNCDELELDPALATAIFRISQEALTNAARHSMATRVAISLMQRSLSLELKIRDNGKGIKERDIFSPSSLGLMGMRERVWPFGGEFNIYGKSAKGTTVFVKIPLQKAAG